MKNRKASFVSVSLLLAAMLVMGTGCSSGGNVKTTPAPTVKPSPTVTVPLTTAPAATSPAVSPSADVVSPKPSGSPSATIDGFKEGEKVDVKKLPAAVTDAVKKKYPDATITGASYATHSDKQTYMLTLSGAADKTDKVYALPDGTLMTGE